nr:NADAR family protein [Deinococcus apachensis]
MSPTVCFYRTAHPFSNFHPSEFTENGVIYHWVEQYLMARKARLFGDRERFAAILSARTPAECKALGRQVTPYDDAVWTRERYAAALDLLRLKFGQNAALREALSPRGTRLSSRRRPPTASGALAFRRRRQRLIATPGARTCWAAS